MTIKEILTKYPKIETDLLLSHVLRKPKEFVFLHGENNITIKQYNNITKLIKRREQGEPIAYILGYKDFCGLRFKVNRDVLIPRPETEWLVERVVSSLPTGQAGDKLQVTSGNIRILDVGTGSGAIIVSLAKQLPTTHYPLPTQLYASDISAKALRVAKANAKTHKVKINFIQSDLFKNIDGKFDVIVANLPYVPMKLLNKFMLNKKLEKDDPFAGLKYEPIFALTDSTNSFQIYRRFFEQVRGFVNLSAGQAGPGSLILLETDPSSKKFLKEYKEKYLPKAKMKFFRDVNGILRFVEIQV